MRILRAEGVGCRGSGVGAKAAKHASRVAEWHDRRDDRLIDHYSFKASLVLELRRA